MSRIFVTGDIHGYIKRIQEINNFCIDNSTNINDVMILLGDVGANYWLDKRDKYIKKTLSNCPMTFICIHGNHEARPSTISSYNFKYFDKFKCKCWYEEEYPNILFPDDGEIYLDNNRCLILGGAYSVDKEYRIRNGLKWFSDEQMSDDKKEDIFSLISKNNSFDYIFSHTAPLTYEPKYLFLSSIDQSTVDKSMEIFLQQVYNTIDEKALKYFLFGHYHDDNLLAPKVRILLNDIIELK